MYASLLFVFATLRKIPIYPLRLKSARRKMKTQKGLTKQTKTKVYAHNPRKGVGVGKGVSPHPEVPTASRNQNSNSSHLLAMTKENKMWYTQIRG